MVSDRLKLVQGHRATPRLWFPFPHLCPGVGCAIEAWVVARWQRYRFEHRLQLGKRRG